MTEEQQTQSDMQELLARPAFLRFLWLTIQSSGLLSRTTDGADGRNLAYSEGRRNLGLDILDMVEKGQPVEHPEKLPLLTLLMAIREETQKPPPEKPNVRRYNRNDELTGPDADDG